MCKLGGPALLCNLENLVALAARFTTELACNRALTVSAPPVYSIYQGDGRSSEFVLSLVRCPLVETVSRRRVVARRDGGAEAVGVGGVASSQPSPVTVRVPCERACGPVSSDRSRGRASPSSFGRARCGRSADHRTSRARTRTRRHARLHVETREEWVEDRAV